MVQLEKNGPLLFVKPFPKLEALEIGCCLDAQEQYVLKKICPDYSVTCINKEGKMNKEHLSQFKTEILSFPNIILMGKQCANLLGTPYLEWRSLSASRQNLIFWFTPALGTMMTSNKRLKQFRAFVEKIRENL
jgi:hypothetical protein